LWPLSRKKKSTKQFWLKIIVWDDRWAQ
jgi:hypothetical protein